MPMKILLIDDNESLNALLTTEFYNNGFLVSSVTTATAALKSLRKHLITSTLVVLDLNLTPKSTTKSSLTFFNQLRAKYPTLPIIIYTGTGDEQLCRDALMQGAAGWYIKGKDQLVTLLDKVKAIASCSAIPEELLSMSVKDCQEAVAVQQTIYALVRAGHNKTQAAKVLHISAKCVHERINKYGLAC